MTKTALYLAGGGARGAYQAGVQSHSAPYQGRRLLILFQASVGSLNAAILAEQATDFKHATEN